MGHASSMYTYIPHPLISTHIHIRALHTHAYTHAYMHTYTHKQLHKHTYIHTYLHISWTLLAVWLFIPDGQSFQHWVQTQAGRRHKCRLSALMCRQDVHVGAQIQAGGRHTCKDECALLKFVHAYIYIYIYIYMYIYYLIELLQNIRFYMQYVIYTYI